MLHPIHLLILLGVPRHSGVRCGRLSLPRPRHACSLSRPTLAAQAAQFSEVQARCVIKFALMDGRDGKVKGRDPSIR